MLTQIKKILYLLGIGLLFAAIFITVNTILDFGIKLDSIHPWLKWAFYTISSLIVLKYLIWPMCRLLMYPRYKPPPKDRDSEEYNKYLFQLRNQFMNSGVLSEKKNDIILKDYQQKDNNLSGQDILTALKKVETVSDAALKEVVLEKTIPALNSISDVIILEKATNVGILTAVSQSGRLDLMIVLANNIMLVNKIIKIYRSRPAMGELLKLYGLAGSAAFIADEFEDLDIGEMMAGSLQGLGLAGSAVPIAGKVIESLSQGAFNAFLTLRVGHAVKKACGATDLNTLMNAKMAGRKEAVKIIPKVVASISARVGKKGVNALKTVWSSIFGKKNKNADDSI